MPGHLSAGEGHQRGRVDTGAGKHEVWDTEPLQVVDHRTATSVHVDLTTQSDRPGTQDAGDVGHLLPLLPLGVHSNVFFRYRWCTASWMPHTTQ